MGLLFEHSKFILGLMPHTATQRFSSTLLSRHLYLFFKYARDENVFSHIYVDPSGGRMSAAAADNAGLIEWRSHAPSGRAHGTYKIEKHEWVPMERK